MEGGRAIGLRHGTAATGPFYCPPDRSLYLDRSFFEELGLAACDTFGSAG